MPVVSGGWLRSLVAWRWFPHAVLFALALVLRVAWVLAVDRAGFAFNDALMYHSTAENLSRGEGYMPFTGGPTARWPPGFSTVLGGLYWLFGIHPVLGELFNAVVGASTVVLLMLVAERTLDRGTAIVAGAMLAAWRAPDRKERAAATQRWAETTYALDVVAGRLGDLLEDRVRAHRAHRAHRARRGRSGR